MTAPTSATDIEVRQSARRILCLHGFRGSGRALRAQMRKLVVGLGPEVELVYVDAPPLAAGGSGWWNAVELEAPAERDGPLAARVKRYEGWEPTRAWLVSCFAQRGPFDAVLGFSQGAALSALLVGLRSPSGVPTPEKPFVFQRAILVGGFKSNDPVHAPLYESRDSFALPSLHLIGRADRVVPPEASLALAACFAAPVIVEHDGGHVVASTAEVRAALATFLAC
jgi:pimeloyl-ACP methyl ester carboxylesterase